MKTSGPIIVFYIFIIIIIKASFFSSPSSVNQPPPKQTKVNVEFKDKQYHIDFNQKKYADSVVNIAQFEAGEGWEGDFTVDEANYVEGLSSYYISSENNITNRISLEKKTDLRKSEFIKIFVFLRNPNDNINIKNFSLRLGDKKGIFSFEYQIPLASNAGWHLIKMPKGAFVLSTRGKEKSMDNHWGNIEKITLELTARPNSKIELSIDDLWAESGNINNIFQVNSLDMFSFRHYSGHTYLQILPYAASSFFLKKISSARDFTYTVKLVPWGKRGTIALVARANMNNGQGYYLELNGIEDNGWKLYKIGNSSRKDKGSVITRLASGLISNFVLDRGVPVWLRIKTKGNTIGGYISSNGTDFSQLTEKSDSEFASGSIGMNQADASYLIESIDFKQ